MKDIKSQSKFCTELMLRLNEEIQCSDKSILENYTRKQEDIRRIRRELMDLQKMLNPWTN